MKRTKLCKSCRGPLKDFHDDEITQDGFCPYCVDEKGNLKCYGDILDGMIEYIESDHPEIAKADRLNTAEKWLSEGEVWSKKFVTDNVVIDSIREGDLKRIKSHEHKEENFSHSCGDCMYYQNCEDSLDKKKNWLKKMEKDHGSCGSVLYFKGELVGYAQCAPKSAFPKIQKSHQTSTDSEIWYISCIFIDSTIPSRRKSQFVKLFLDDTLNKLNEKGVKLVQVSAPIRDGTISSTPFDWEYYKTQGFKEIERDNEYVVGELILD